MSFLDNKKISFLFFFNSLEKQKFLIFSPLSLLFLPSLPPPSLLHFHQIYGIGGVEEQDRQVARG